MAYRLPVFNITVNIWRPTTPLTSPPDVVTLANLAWSRRVNQPDQGGGYWHMTLLLPPLTDVRSTITGQAAGDSVEAPAGSKRLYRVRTVDDIGKGFANEHRAAGLIAVSLAGWWVPPIP
jgi:hypothetical protein